MFFVCFVVYRSLFSLRTFCASAAGVVGGTITGCRVMKSLTSMVGFLRRFGNDWLKAAQGFKRKMAEDAMLFPHFTP